MSCINGALLSFLRRGSVQLLTVLAALLVFQSKSVAQTFDFPATRYVDSISLRSVVTSSGNDTVTVFPSLGSGFTIKSILALTNFKVNVQSTDIGQKHDFTYLITYKTIGYPSASGTGTPTVSNVDTLSVSYNRDSLKIINDRAFAIAGSFYKLKVVIYDVFEVTISGGSPVYTHLLPASASTVPTFVNVSGEIFVQKYITAASINMTAGNVVKTDNINTDGTVLLNWNAAYGSIKPAGYEVEWTYADAPSNSQYDFRNNATRIFTNNTSFTIPVAQKDGYLVFRVRMLRPDLTNLEARTYGSWTLTTNSGTASSVSSSSMVHISKSSNDSLNWDLKTSFVEDGKYKGVITYYDGLLKPKQVQTRFNSRPTQTIIAQSLYDYEGRAVVNSLPIPVSGVSKFAYYSNFLHPAGATEYDKLTYDAIPDTGVCPATEVAIPPLDPAIKSNEYYSANNPTQTGKHAYIPDAEGYPMTRKILAAENSEKVLFEGQAGSALQLGHDRQTSYVYNSPIQSELNKYFGQDVGQAVYYRKMVTTDNHDQDMFSITDDEGKMVITGLIGSPDTNSLALSIKNSPTSDSFSSNLMPVPNIRLSEQWKNNGAYYVERDANYGFEYRIDYRPFKPCPSVNVGLKPKVYYSYEVLDNCGNVKLTDSGVLGGIGITTASLLSDSALAYTFLKKMNHVWNKHSYIKIEDLAASVDAYLDSTRSCFRTYNDFVKDEFLKENFPCPSNYDPCATMREIMIKELYPRAKYGSYTYTDSVSKEFDTAGVNSIFSIGMGTEYLYQTDCIDYPDTIYYMGKKYTEYEIKHMAPQDLIDVFNDSIAAALLPFHPDYCKLLMCPLINDPYAKTLGMIKTASDGAAINRFLLDTIAAHDPLFTTSFVTFGELVNTAGDSLRIDSIAFKKTICGSELGVIEATCAELNAGKTPADIGTYPVYMQDEYYRTLMGLYNDNRNKQIDIKMRALANSCGPCASLRLTDPTNDSPISGDDDTTFMVRGVDSLTKKTQLPVHSTFGNYFTNSGSITQDSLNNLMNINSSIYCTTFIDNIINSLNGCNVSQTLMNTLRDTLTNRYCNANNNIGNLTYDVLTTTMGQIGISTNDLCNAGLADLRKLTNVAGDFVQLGLLQYQPAYYDDIKTFLASNSILDFIAGSSTSMTVQLAQCNTKPFQQGLAKQLGGSSSGSNCASTLGVTLTRSFPNGTGAVRLAFTNSSNQVDYYLYPATKAETNALNSTFTSAVISNTTNYAVKSLFNPYGFDKISQSFANRNTVVVQFEGTQSSTQKKFRYYMSAFNVTSDYNTMEKDQVEYLNGVSCSDFIPMAKAVLTKASALGIKLGHPYFERYFQNVMNYDNKINFTYANYESAIQTCGLTDSIVIQKTIAHFKIKMSSSVSDATVETFLDTLALSRGIGLSDVQAYTQGSDKYLLLNVFEANGNTIAGIKTVIQAKMPSGSTMHYLPYLHRDTVAQLFSCSVSPVDGGALATAFPTATITTTPVTFHYFISGYGTFSFSGNIITMQNSISNDFTYNHYVDSICKFIAANTPTTAIYSHAESAVSAQYADWQMTAWRNFVRNIPSGNPNNAVKKSKPANFNTISASNGSYSFSASKFSYLSARRPYYLNDLYIDHEPTSNTTFNNIKTLLLAYQTYNNSTFLKNTLLKASNPVSPVTTMPGFSGTETRAYVCGDTTVFWINHFDTVNLMTNVFIKLPDYLPMPRTSYYLYSVEKGFEKDSITYFTVKFDGWNGSWHDTMQCVAYSNRNLGATYTIPSAFLSSHSQYEYMSDKFANCETRTIETIYPAAKINYHAYIDSVREALIVRFRQHVIDSLQEQLNIRGRDIKHGITLYYYDMAGNLLKTVSPGGVKTLSVASKPDNDTINAYRLRNQKINPKIPAHTKVTSYKYNAQNKVRQTSSPDGGTVNSWYDQMGRVVFSQDANQVSAHDYTYFLYDNLSRVIETGVVNWPGLSFAQPISTAPGSTTTTTLKTKPRREVTATIYDVPSYATTTLQFSKLPAQENLKNRVASTRYFEALAPNADALADTNYSNALHYSYDVSGNVKTLVHDLKNVIDSQLRIKRVDYEYDLYSGKVIMLSYNRGHADQFYQKYSYDADNRIVDVNTSNNGLYWDRDAHYDYYDHGPLARMDLGQQRVQGVDYAYTINGWLKATNGVQNTALADIGKDGTSGGVLPQDVFSQRIDYFNGDYKAIKDSNYFRELPAVTKNLYNGNIAGIAIALTPFDNLQNKYLYDPLQRIDHAEYKKYDYNYGTSTLTTSNLVDWRSDYKYDLDGNLLTLKRQGAAISAAMNGGTPIVQHMMDSLTYRYTANTNQLKNLQDSSASTAYVIDIPPTMSDTALALYQYDGNGNMIKDIVSGLTSIKWNRFGKVSSVTKTNGSKINFSYDPMGNRLAKELVTYPNSDSMVKLKTVYVRDAAGNTLAVYEDQREFDLEKITPTVLNEDPGAGFPGGHVPRAFSGGIAKELQAAYLVNPNNNLSRLAMTIPQLNDLVENSSLLQEYVGTLSPEQTLAFVKSIPGITQYGLMSTNEGDDLTSEQLAAYLEPVMLSPGLGEMQLHFFTMLKQLNSDLFHTVMIPVVVDEGLIDNFPDDPALMEIYNAADIKARQTASNTLAESLAGENIETMRLLMDEMTNIYSNNNTYPDFVFDLPDGGDNNIDVMKIDAVNYIGYRYGLVESEELPIDTVKAQFKFNPALAGALSGTEIDASEDGLTSVLNDHFDDVLTLAAASGQTSNLVAAFKLNLSAIDMDVMPASWLLAKEILTSDRVYLGEHHIYGSSRLGMQKYLPSELQFRHKPGLPTTTYQSLVQLKPWYSLYGNDLFKSNIYSNALNTTNMGYSDMGINSHLLGNRHYELTNHLSNVQATILDRTTPLLSGGEELTLTGYHAEISNVWDYYPFGMLMPGRYISDTAKHCVTVNTTIMAPRPFNVRATLAQAQGMAYRYEGSPAPPVVNQLPSAADFEHEILYVYHYIAASSHPGGKVVPTDLSSTDVAYRVDLSGEPSGVTAYFQLHPDTNQTDQAFSFGTQLASAAQLQMRIRQYYNSASDASYYQAMEWTDINTSGDQNFSLHIDKTAIRNGGRAVLEFRFTTHSASFPTNTRVSILTPIATLYTLQPVNSVATICDEKDNYRFGFNGKEKDNEPKGLGNSYDYGFRMYDSRIGRFMAVDPLTRKYPWYSPYQFAGNTPIQAIDLEGAEELRVTSQSSRFYARAFILATKSAELHKIYESISRPDKADKVLVYLTTHKTQVDANENAFTLPINLKPIAENLVLYDKMLSDGTYKQQKNFSDQVSYADKWKAKFSNMGINYNEVARAKQPEVYVVSVYSGDADKYEKSAMKSLAHETEAHLPDMLDNGVNDRDVQTEHADYYNIKKGSPEFKKYGMDQGSSPEDKDVKSDSRAGKVYKEIDAAYEKLPSQPSK